MRIGTNVAAIIANNSLQKSQNNLSTSIERLSSGYKINGSKDDAAGCAISEIMRVQLRGLDQAENNTADGISVISTAEGAINVAINNTKFTLHGANVLVLGFGRVGKVLAQKLQGMGANVYCEARKKSDLSLITAYRI